MSEVRSIVVNTFGLYTKGEITSSGGCKLVY